MPLFERATLVDAPLEHVWAFHSRIEGLEALTPKSADLRVVSIDWPEEAEPPILCEGTKIRLRTRPGIDWVSAITARHRDDEIAMFRDELVEGPVDRMRHSHWFIALEEGTLVFDRIEYDAPFLSLAAKPVLAIAFWDRHRRTRALLE